jgi:hypothetical protein
MRTTPKTNVQAHADSDGIAPAAPVAITLAPDLNQFVTEYCTAAGLDPAAYLEEMAGPILREILATLDGRNGMLDCIRCRELDESKLGKVVRRWKNLAPLYAATA